MKNMKHIFLKISKICFISFFIALSFFICFAIATKDEKITIPIVLGIYFLVSTFAVLICIIIAWILDLIESIRSDKLAYISGYAILSLILWAAIIAVDYFIRHTTVDLPGSFIKAFSSVCTVKAANYIFAKKNNT